MSSVSGPVPKVIARLYDKEENVLKSWVVEPAATELEPGQSVEFSDRLVNPPKGAVNLTVQLMGAATGDTGGGDAGSDGGDEG